MTQATLAELFDRNDRHTDSLAPDHFDGVEDAQHPAVVSLCCSDSRVSQEGMWDVVEPGWLFTPSNIGNVAWDDTGVVDGNLLYPVAFTNTRTVAIVGHTGCGAVTAAHTAATTDEYPAPVGVRRRVELLVPVIERGLKTIDPARKDVVDALVEWNVCEQVMFLTESDAVPAETTILGFVYDLHKRYGEAAGRVYLVSVNGETADETLTEWADGTDRHIETLL
jgi:carbonic anhydrase